MAAIGNSIFSQNTTPQNPTAPSAGNNSNSNSPNSGASDPLANESTFLTLLVSQLKNQDPSSPMDGTTFVTQLAQFSDLEQNLAMRQDLDAISTKYDGTSASPTAATSGTAGSDGSTTPQGI